MAEPLFMPIILGSIRDGRRSEHAANYLAQRVQTLGHHTEVLDLRALSLPMYAEGPDETSHPGILAFRASLERSDASIWLSPEYNHSFTGVIKNAIDHVEKELHHKPVVACGLSAGAHGGIRATEGLKMVLIEMRALPIRDSVHFGEARQLFGTDGALLKPEFARRVDLVISELVWHAEVLRWGRAHVARPE